MVKQGIWNRLKRLALTNVKVIAKGGVDAKALEDLEALLLQSDFGTTVSTALVDGVRRRRERVAGGKQLDVPRACCVGSDCVPRPRGERSGEDDIHR